MRFLHGLALRERSLLPVLQPRLPGAFERRESLVEPGWDGPRAKEPMVQEAPVFEAAADPVASEPAVLPPVQRRARSVEPARADPPLVVEPVRPRAFAALLPAEHDGEEAVDAEPAPTPSERVAPAPRQAQPVADRHSAPPAIRVQAPRSAEPAVRTQTPVALAPDDAPPAPPVQPAAVLPRWTPQPALARGRVQGATMHRFEAARVEAPASTSQAPVEAAPALRHEPSHEHRAPPKTNPAPLAVAELTDPRVLAEPPQGRLVEAEPRRWLTPALVQQVQAQPAVLIGHEAAALPAGPTVHVSIGRVEIRAAALAAAPTPARAKAPGRAPMLSLTDYLQQRGGVKRSGPGGAR